MADSLDTILQSLDAAYNPSVQSINKRLDGLQGAQDADVAGLQGQQTQAFDDITNGARSRGIGFSGIPLQEQAKYTSGTFLPAVARLKSSYNDSRNSLSDALNSLNQDKYKTALSVQGSQQDRDFQAQQAALARADATRAADRAAAASAASSKSLSSLLNGGTQGDAKPDAYATVNKDGANTAIKQLLATNNVDTIKNTINAISASAGRGNLYDKYKLDLIASLQGNSQYGNILQKVSSVNNKVTF